MTNRSGTLYMAKCPGLVSMLRGMSPGLGPLLTCFTDATSNAGPAWPNATHTETAISENSDFMRTSSGVDGECSTRPRHCRAIEAANHCATAAIERSCGSVGGAEERKEISRLLLTEVC